MADATVLKSISNSSNNTERALSELMGVRGALGVAIVDYDSGMMLASQGTAGVLEVAAAANSEVINAKQRAIKLLGLDDSIDDILVSLTKQYHLLRPVKAEKGLFIYYMLDAANANLALARLKLKTIESEMLFI
ncbi:MAG TPA: hypothetical protein VGE28_01435 [Pseudomonas sp.]